MTEFTFRVRLQNGATFTYSLRANEKLDAVAKIKQRFPSSYYELVTSGSVEDKSRK